jgi:pseudouridine-5'-phosphate glycosidase/pseudouridine kinase
MLMGQMEAMGMRTDGLIKIESEDSSASSTRTAVCNMVLDQGGGLVGGVADMDIINSMQPQSVRTALDPLSLSTNHMLCIGTGQVGGTSTFDCLA